MSLFSSEILKKNCIFSEALAGMCSKLLKVLNYKTECTERQEWFG